MNLEWEVVETLKRRKLTIATAESCTGGMLSHRITNVPGSSEVFIGGVIAYSNDLKVKLLGVPNTLISKWGAVSEEVARAMAKGICEVTGSDLGIGITGIAGPTGGSIHKPVGLVYIGLSNATINITEVHKNNFNGTREEIKLQSTETALRLILVHLNKYADL
ncbi:MAG: CinA family protein [Candidatus Hydrogenedentes bacterium]|nr:CinA family protein [Candidatus Hydrogenedentota bacterium]